MREPQVTSAAYPQSVRTPETHTHTRVIPHMQHIYLLLFIVYTQKTH